MKPPASIPGSALSFFASLLLLVLSYQEHTRSCRPSFLLVCYLCITALLRAVMVRTYWSLGGEERITWTKICSVIVQLTMIVLESWTKRDLFLKSNDKLSREETASFLSRSLFLWINNTMGTGYR